VSNLLQLGKDVWSLKRLIIDLSRNDFKTRYAGSYFGMLWAFVQPVMTILVFWFVFEVGFRASHVQGVPFILWFSCGLIPWFFFADAWANASSSFVEYSYLVKKVVFKISTLPLIKVISSLYVHLFFVGFLLFLFLIYGYRPDWWLLQLGYYLACMIVLTLSLSFMTASIVPFFKDMTQIIGIVLQFGMWITPIMWPYSMVPAGYRWLFSLNPMYYIVEGYRDTLINKILFIDKPEQALIFWAITLVLLLLGTLAFKRLKPHFADVL
jgi:teichoic acid transport system permease protein